MATRKKIKAKSKAPKKTLAKKSVAKKPVAKKPAPKKKTVAKKQKPVPDAGSTQQIAIAEIMGDIEERMALDRLAEN